MKKIFIAEDHPLFYVGLREIINDEDGLIVCGNSKTVSDALIKIPQLAPDMVIVDISLKESNGLELVRELKRFSPRMPVLVLSMHDESLYAERSILAGAKGYIMKQEAPKSVIKAIKKLFDNKIYVSETVKDALLERLRAPIDCDDNGSPLDRLTRRELTVFEMIGAGLTSKQIAQRMNLSIKTIGTHKDRIKVKLSLKNVNELISFAARWNAF